MEKKLKQLIAREDKRNPLTDQQAAEKLSVRREEITLLRSELGIPDSRERRREQLTADARKVMAAEPGISARALTEQLQAMGYDLSRHVAGQLLKELSNSTPKQISSMQPQAFSNLIGWNGSLRTQIQQAKAAVIYPPTGLHTLILGESGVGKSELAESMFRYSIETGQRSETAPFIVFNCADYAENPQLLLSQLFGHIRGAYTGAQEDKAGLVEKADGGILFLDEIHRLPPEGQEILYSMIDKGCYRRLGETESNYTVSLMLIAATTEDPESTLLVPFRRRIPMVIELPPLHGRPMEERLEIILHFFHIEANRVGKTLTVRRDVLKALLLTETPGNVGQLKSSVQVACARGLLNHFGAQQEEVLITLNELSFHSQQAILNGYQRCELEELLAKDEIFYPLGGEQGTKALQANIYALPDEIYTRIEELVKGGLSKGLSSEEASQWASQQLEQEFTNIIGRIENIKPSLSRHDLEKMVGSELTTTVAEMVEIASVEKDVKEEQLFFYLSIHLNAALERIRCGEPIINAQLPQAKKEYEQEYLVAVKMAAAVKRHLGVTLPDEEIGFIALYLRAFYGSNRLEEGQVVVLVLSHGRVAREMVNVVHTLLKDNRTYSLDMALTESPEDFLTRVLIKAREINRGRGILLLVDMGSLVTFGKRIEGELGIPVRVIDRVDLVMVLEASRWAMLPGDRLDEIADELIRAKATGSIAMPKQSKQLLVTVCLSGCGGAEKIKAFLDSHLGGTGVEVKAIGVMDESRLRSKVKEWQKEYQVAAIVGTIDPELPGIPFIPFQSVNSGLGMDYLKSLLTQRPAAIVHTGSCFNRDMIIIKADWEDKYTVIRSLGQLLLKSGFVKPGYIESVFAREEFAPTCIEGGIAIPHADPKYVKKTGLAIATLRKPIKWWGLEVDVVCLLALKVTDRQLFANLLKVFKDVNKMNRIRSAQTAQIIEEEVLNVIGITSQKMEINRPTESRF